MPQKTVDINMSTDQVKDFIRKMSFGNYTEQYAEALASLGVEGDDLPYIDEAMLEEAGIAAKIHRMKLIRNIHELIHS